MARERAIGFGYVIADANGIVMYSTLRRSRSDCWNAFLEDKTPYNTKYRLKKQGFRAVPVFVRETLDSAKGNGK